MWSKLTRGGPVSHTLPISSFCPCHLEVYSNRNQCRFWCHYYRHNYCDDFDPRAWLAVSLNSSGVGTQSADNVKWVSSSLQPVASWPVHELRGYSQVSFSDTLITVTSPPHFFAVIQKLIAWLSIPLSPLLKFHHRLMSWQIRAWCPGKTTHWNIEYLLSTITINSPFAMVQFRTMPSRLLVSALHSCFFSRTFLTRNVTRCQFRPCMSLASWVLIGIGLLFR